MNHTSDPNNFFLSMVSAFFAVVTLTAIQPWLTFIASLVAIASGIYSMHRTYKKSKNK